MSDLKPCPHCGESRAFVEDIETAQGLKWYVFCYACGATGGYKVTPAKAIEAWNTRSDAALNKAAGNWAHADKLLRGLLEECERCPDTGCTQYIEKVVKPNLRSVDK